MSRRRRGRGRMQPTFPPATWNCYDRTVGNLSRTTNPSEAWHNRLNTLMGKPHPSFYHVLEQLRQELTEIENDNERLESGLSPPKKRKKTEEIDVRIRRVVDNYEEYEANGEIPKYRRSIGHILAGRF